MSTQNRKTLYSYFEEGKLPSTQDFKDLVDSTLNVYDEGFHKTPLNGVKISTPVGPYSALLSFYREASFSVDSDKDTPLWAVRYGQDPYPLLFQIGTGGTPVLSLHQRKDQLPQRVGINTDRPRHALEVAGTVGARGRIGTSPCTSPPTIRRPWSPTAIGSR